MALDTGASRCPAWLAGCRRLEVEWQRGAIEEGWARVVGVERAVVEAVEFDNDVCRRDRRVVPAAAGRGAALRSVRSPLWRLRARIAYGFRSTHPLALCLLDRGGHCPLPPGSPVTT